MLVGKSFVVQPDIYLRHERNRAFVMGEAARPAAFGPLWLAVGISAIIDIAAILIGLNVLPLELPESLIPMRPWLLLIGVIGIPGTIFLGWMFSKIQNQGTLLEGRVVIADIRPSPSRPNRNVQHIQIDFKTPDGKTEALVIRRPPQGGAGLPRVGAQAAVLYAGPNRFQVM
ncbi:MAG: hypothetical protein K8I30_14820 [Anaerolineae bacterium]|nr:hypothetical protein [Anaerolineae bacterium]